MPVRRQESDAELPIASRLRPGPPRCKRDFCLLKILFPQCKNRFFLGMVRLKNLTSRTDLAAGKTTAVYTQTLSAYAASARSCELTCQEWPSLRGVVCSDRGRLPWLFLLLSETVPRSREVR